ncbi:hypothetical protein AKJ52_00980 [candidate division MSBL1 archaeon SCGC-AAA382C18]|uniref:Mevalonate kinase n=1 Tax=candidate division MSBL1 archaeon SCGC-AAA382C18 TaxID=1698281 RepID=A0A133VKV3_9EURY|nr:hypothetical protein AKJ52_00980 [candidate division MSBL1 archaeon SCGC-AAA382C18]
MGESTEEVSAPGQVFLFGEHAVVYGQPALATAINVRTDVSGEILDGPKFEVVSEKVGHVEGNIEKKNGKWIISDKGGDVEELSFVTKVTELTFNHVQNARGLKLHIESGLPLGSGLGSSSAVTTATAAAVSSILDEDLEREEIAQLAFDAEIEIQGAASRTGVNVATYGGFLRVLEDERKKLEELSELGLIIGYTGKYANTGELVAGVRARREEKPEIINPMIETIGNITDTGIKALKKDELEKIGVLINANQNLLEGLGVSSPELRTLIKATRDSGAIGAKLTGAGGGGCMIALSPNNREDIVEAIEDENGKAIKAKVGAEGLRY